MPTLPRRIQPLHARHVDTLVLRLPARSSAQQRTHVDDPRRRHGARNRVALRKGAPLGSARVRARARGGAVDESGGGQGCDAGRGNLCVGGDCVHDGAREEVREGRGGWCRGTLALERVGRDFG